VLLSFCKSILKEEKGQSMIEYLLLMFFTIAAIYGLEISFKEVLAPAFKRMTAIVRWPIP
jgi:Flp pilus assembly pilin Flp